MSLFLLIKRFFHKPRNLFIDLGAHVGDTILKAKEELKCDSYYAFEPSKQSYKKLKDAKFTDTKLFPFAVGIKKSTGKLYHGIKKHQRGNSLFSDKSNCSQTFEKVKIIDFSNFLKKNTFPEDKITLKLDIEGSEYNILEKLIKTDQITNIDKIYCEWHYDRILSITKKRHNNLLKKLREKGFIKITEFGT